MTEKKVWGATPAEWDHFRLTMGIGPDLLPVVSNPHATKSSQSKIGGPGKVPSYYNGDGEMVGMAKWTEKQATGADIVRWSANSDYGICIQTRNIRAIDVDVDDYDESEDIRAALSGFGAFPVRSRRNSMKFLVAFEMPGDFTKRRFKTHKGVIEFLAGGQQFVALGTHPSGARYEWEGGLPNGIPKLAPEQFEAIWRNLNERFGTEDSVETRSGAAPTEKRKAADANDPLVQFLEEKWTVYGTDRSGRVDILCPFHEEHTSESGESATSYFPAGVGGFDAGNFKCQHAHCAHRSKLEFEGAIGYVAEDFDVLPLVPPAKNGVAPKQPLPPEINTARKKNGRIAATRNSVRAALYRPDICGVHIGFDLFQECIMLAEREGEWRPFKDKDYYNITAWLEAPTEGGFEHVPTEIIRGAVETVADKNAFDSAQLWLGGLKWDGKPRVEQFLTKAFGTEDTPYHRAVSTYWWSGQAGRVLVPGIKADMVPIAVGDQGARKSSTVEAMCPDKRFHLELDLDKGDDDIAREMRGTLVAELGELKGANSKKLEHVKSLITRGTDKWVPKYKEFASEYARRCMFFGTTNDDEPLPDDDTGQRRWLPFNVPHGFLCDVDWVVANRNQLWAEAAVIFTQRGGVVWAPAEKLARTEHAQYQKDDSWRYVIEDWLFCSDMGEEPPVRRIGGLRLHEIITGALSLPVASINRGHETRVGRCLKVIGMRKTVKDGHKVWVPGTGVKFR